MRFVDLLDILASTKTYEPRLQRKFSDTVEIRDGITFDFYTGLPHRPVGATVRPVSQEIRSGPILIRADRIR